MTTKRQMNTTRTTLLELAELVKTRRHDQGLSLRAAAEQIGCSWTTLRHFEELDHSPRLDLVIALLNWLEA